MDPSYRPINCGFHDQLLELATYRRICEIAYLDEAEQQRTVQGRIEDVYSRAGAEYMRVSDGSIIRLDRLLQVDGRSPPAPGG